MWRVLEGRKEMPLPALSPSLELNLSKLGSLCDLSPWINQHCLAPVASFLGTKFHCKKHWEANHEAAKTKAVYIPLLQNLLFRGNVEVKKINKSCSERRANYIFAKHNRKRRTKADRVMSIFGTPDREEKSVSLMADFILKVPTDILKGHKNTERRELFSLCCLGCRSSQVPPGFSFF